MPHIKKRFILKNPFRLILIILFLTGLISLKPLLVNLNIGHEQDVQDQNPFGALESYIPAQMEQHRVPGLSLAIFQDQNIMFNKGFGVKNAASGEPVDEDTIFQAASFSKTLTAYAAMILVERGLLSLDEPLDKYLARSYLPDAEDAQRITLRMVLNHTSGLSNDSDGNDRKVYFTPGAYFSYSGAGFRYLQHVIEKVTELPFASFVDREIMKPLGMKSSSFVFKDEMLPLLATGHEAGKAFPISKKDVNAAYSLLSNPTDMARFNMEICHPTLLKPETVAQMLHASVKWQNDIYWGLGLGILKSPGEDFFWHWGNNYYYTSIMITGKESKAGVVIMTNGNTGMRLAERLAIKIINEYFLDKKDSLAPETFDFIT